MWKKNYAKFAPAHLARGTFTYNKYYSSCFMLTECYILHEHQTDIRYSFSLPHNNSPRPIPKPANDFMTWLWSLCWLKSTAWLDTQPPILLSSVCILTHHASLAVTH